MPRIVKCIKLGQELPAIVYKPFNNELGQRIFASVSQQAWMMWVEFSKKIVNEYRLDLTSPMGQKVLLEQCEQFFFGGGGQNPPEWKPEQADGDRVVGAGGDPGPSSGSVSSR
jgi:Fe-S cluster biosynthesis and repair protein YggX